MNARPLIAARLLATSGGAFAKGSERAGAINAGQFGEQANGFLGVHGNVPDRIRAGIEAINIKRRAAYTELAGQRGVAVKDVAATVGCTTLKTQWGQLRPISCATACGAYGRVRRRSRSPMTGASILHRTRVDLNLSPS